MTYLTRYPAWPSGNVEKTEPDQHSMREIFRDFPGSGTDFPYTTVQQVTFAFVCPSPRWVKRIYFFTRHLSQRVQRRWGDSIPFGLGSPCQRSNRRVSRPRPVNLSTSGPKMHQDSLGDFTSFLETPCHMLKESWLLSEGFLPTLFWSPYKLSIP